MRTTLLVLALIPLAGCNPLAGLEGDWSRGELGRTRWQIADGLCPGLGGGCSLDVPLAVGADTVLVVEGAEEATFDPEVTGALSSSSATRDEEDGDWRVSVAAATPGTGVVEFTVGSEVLDRASVEVRRATRLECGILSPSTDVSWDMPELSPTNTLALAFVEEGESSGQLVCRASDAAGPLLSVDAIVWEVIEGGDILQLQGTGLFGGPMRGARLRYDTVGSGPARIRVTLGEVTQELAVTVECPIAGCE